MKLDMDLVRTILLVIEESETFNGTDLYVFPKMESHHSADEINYHLSRLIQANLVEGKADPGRPALVRGLTWAGHEYLNTIRDPLIWKRTKDELNQVGEFSFDLVKAMAKGFIKKQIEDRTGVKLDI